MNRIKYENYLGAAGYDAVARRKIKELEKKIGPQMVEKVLFDQSVELIELDGIYTLDGTLGISAAFVPGQTYKVEIEGESFECVAKELNVFEGTASYIGNAANLSNPDTGESFGDDTGEPFTVVTMSMNGVAAMTIVIAAPATYVADITHTFHVKITTMEEKTSGGGVMRINVTASVDEYDNDVYSADRTYQEILDALATGILPYCVLGNGVYMLSVSEELSSIATYARAYCHHFARVDCLDGMPSIYSISIDAYDNVSVGNCLLAVAQG